MVLQEIDVEDWPWLVQLINNGYYCWFNSSIVAMMWSMKTLQIELIQPDEDDWTFWGWITYWYNLERCNSRQGIYLTTQLNI